MAEIVRLLSRGAKFKEKPTWNVQLDKEPLEVEQHQIHKSVDFFRTNVSKPRAATTPVSDNEEISIKTERDGQILRMKNRINIQGQDAPLPFDSFPDLRSRYQLPAQVLDNLLTKLRFCKPTPIQSEAIPIMLQGRDLIACAPTGSGKTLAFCLPIVNKIENSKKQKNCLCVIVSPTKELASQIYSHMTALSRKVKVLNLTRKEVTKLRDKTGPVFNVLVTTPLRLTECVKEALVDLSHVTYLVLDEADKLFEKGFLEQTDEVIAACSNPSLQKVIFSATIPSGVEQLANSIMTSPIRVIVGHTQAANASIDQRLVYTGNEQGKLVAIRQMMNSGELVPPTLIFVQSVVRAKALYSEMMYDKMNVDAIHSEKSTSQRERVIERFRRGDIWILICTDVLARGIDFKGVSLVINYDVPQSAQSYVHRIGRTGRAGRQGKAITFFTQEDRTAIKTVVNVMRQSNCDVSEWMNKIQLKPSHKKKLKRSPVDRRSISTQQHKKRKLVVPGQ